MRIPEREVCYRALESRDARFDGLIFVGVSTTGVYCRPVCPARTPKFSHVRFFASAAAAQKAGFRPCLRCRPETAPDMASWRGSSSTVSRALGLIAEGALSGKGASLARLADRLGVGDRHLRRLFLQHLGASPVSIAQSRRALFARQLIHETDLPLGEIARASGFGSIRRFNETFQAMFRQAPGTLRRNASGRGSAKDAGVAIRIRYRPPYDWESMLAFCAARAIPGVEVVEKERYLRTVAVGKASGTVEVFHLPQQQSLGVTIRFPDVRALPLIVARVRRQFDTGADIQTIDAHLANDPLMQPLVERRPGLRAPGSWDGFELAMRAALGQQISVSAARRLAGELVRQHGARVSGSGAQHPGLTHVFPTARQIATVPAMGLKMPGSRQRTLQAIARAFVDDPNLFSPFGSVEEIVERLRTIPGVGDWTAHYIALRAVREMDAFPSSDIGLLRGARALGCASSNAAMLARRAEEWRPWRGYAAQHLWAADSTRPLEKKLAAAGV